MALGFRPRLWPTLIALPIVLGCLALGAWQLQRLEWKRGLIAERAAALVAPPAPPPQSLAEARGMEFRRVIDEGVFLNDKEIFLGASAGAGQIGYHVLTPLREPGGRIVFVNRGFIPSELKDPARRAAGEPSGTVRVAGLLRLPPAGKPGGLLGAFLPDNNPGRNFWFWVDLPAMSAATGLPDVAPFYIDADAAANPGGWPKGGVTPASIPNDHLQYAITWFALALGMAVIYVVYHRQAGGK